VAKRLDGSRAKCICVNNFILTCNHDSVAATLRIATGAVMMSVLLTGRKRKAIDEHGSGSGSTKKFKQHDAFAIRQ